MCDTTCIRDFSGLRRRTPTVHAAPQSDADVAHAVVDLEILKSFVLRLRNAKMIHQLSNFEIPKMSIIFSTDAMYSESCCEEEHVW